MPWQRLQDWIEARTAGSTAPGLDLGRALTLVKLSLDPGAMDDEVHFYRDAEFELLSSWIAAGRLLVVLVSLKGNELTLLCPDSLPRTCAMMERLPLVGAGLAHPELTPVVGLWPPAGPPTRAREAS